MSDQRIADLARLATTLADRVQAAPLPVDRPAAAEERTNRLRALREAASQGQRVLQRRAETGLR